MGAAQLVIELANVRETILEDASSTTLLVTKQPDKDEHEHGPPAVVHHQLCILQVSVSSARMYLPSIGVRVTAHSNFGALN